MWGWGQATAEEGAGAPSGFQMHWRCYSCAARPRHVSAVVRPVAVLPQLGPRSLVTAGRKAVGVPWLRLPFLVNPLVTRTCSHHVRLQASSLQ